MVAPLQAVLKWIGRRSDLPAGDAVSARNRAFWKTLASSYGLRVVTITTNLVSVPLCARHLGTERYGLWLAMGSFISVLGLCEFGLGNNLTTLIAQARGRGDVEACARHVSATVWAVVVAAGAMFAIFAMVHPHLDWSAIFNVSGPVAVVEAPRAAFLIGVIGATQLITGLCGRIYAGLQQGYRGALWQALSAVAGLIALIITSFAEGGLVALAVALGLVPALVQLAGLVWVLRAAEYGRFRRPAMLAWADYRTVVGGGALMFVVNLQAIFWLTKDNLLIAHALNLDEVGRYNTAWRIYTAVFGLLAGSVGASLWPAYADAFSRGDRAWIRSAICRSLVVNVAGMVVFSVLFLTMGEQLLTWYVGAPLVSSREILAWLGGYFTCLTAVNLLSFPLMATDRVGVIAWGGLAGGLISVPLGLEAVRRFGIAGLIAVNFICVLFCILFPLVRSIRRMLS